MTIGAGIITGNIIGFGRVALTAYLLGTHSQADSLAVAIGPVDTLNAVLINSMVFAFVPLLTEREGASRTALFLKLSRLFTWFFSLLSVGTIVFAPWLIRILAPGLEPVFAAKAVTILRIVSLSTMAAGLAAIHSALLYTDRRFAPFAFYQAALNTGTIVGALSLWSVLGVYGFPIGYTLGAWAQLGVVSFCARSRLKLDGLPRCDVHWREIITKPASFVLYAGGLALNIIFTRAYATHTGPGMAAALDYCMRGVGVPLAFLVSPMSNSLLPEIARLRSEFRIREAFHLIDKTIALAALAAIGGCAVAIVFRRPAIALLFQRGSFTVESTDLVSAVFLGLGPSMIGWSLIELTSRSLFAMAKPLLPLVAAVIPVLFNVGFTFWMGTKRPELLGLGSSLGLMIGFVLLFTLARINRRRWLT